MIKKQWHPCCLLWYVFKDIIIGNPQFPDNSVRLHRIQYAVQKMVMRQSEEIKFKKENCFKSQNRLLSQRFQKKAEENWLS